MSTPAGIAARRFVTAAEKVDFKSPWTIEEWLCRGDVVPNQELLLVRANMEAGHCHPFHTHPTREEIIYVISGRAEQWCGQEYRILGPGEMVLIPKGEVHGTYNPFRERLVFLAILSPSNAAEPGIVDVSETAPWKGLRESHQRPACTMDPLPAVKKAGGSGRSAKAANPAKGKGARKTGARSKG